jgi:hypothetical protein
VSVVSVFLSSTFKDLVEERTALITALGRFDGVHVVAMEAFGSRPGGPAEVSIDRVNDSDIYVGLIGDRFGSGITRQEYEQAYQLGLVCVVTFYGRPDGQPIAASIDRAPDDLARLEEFKTLLQSRHIIESTQSVTDLVGVVLAAVRNQIGDINPAAVPEQLDDLPFLLDRDPQTNAIEDIILKVIKAERPMPTAFVIPGLTLDLHAGLVRRYEAFPLPDLFRALRAQVPGVDGSSKLSWPDVDGSAARFTFMRRDLNDALGLDRNAAIEVTRAALQNLGRTRLFVCSIPVSSWRSDDPQVLKDWLNFWREARPATGAFPMVFLCLEFDPPVKGGWLSPLRKWSSARCERDAQEWLDRLSTTAPDVELLPRLKMVSLGQARTWAQSRCGNVFKNLNTIALTAEVDREWNGRDERHMSDLLEPMRTALTKAWKPRKGHQG